MSVDRDSAVRPRTGLLHRELDGETVVLDPDRGIYYGLDDTGTAVWRALQTTGEEPRPLEDVHGDLLEHYEVEADELWNDLLALIRELDERGLVDVVR